MVLASTLFISLFITIALTPLCNKLAIRFHALDIPDKRKVHAQPVPRSGGIAMALGFFTPVILWGSLTLMMKGILIGAGIIVLFGVIDDFKNLSYKTKFAGQLVAALVVVLYGGIKIKSLGMLLPDDVLLPEWFATLFTILVIVGITNAINLADGLDGLAGGICLLGFICMGYLAYQCDNFTLALMSASVAGAIFGFLRFNTYPATLFMGDAGSQFLGFVGATLSIGLTQFHTALNSFLPLLIWGVPLFDTAFVLMKRTASGRPLFMPDRRHLHHDLIRFGLYHTEAVFVIYSLQAFLVVCAVLFRFHSEWLLLSFYLIFFGFILFGFWTAHKSHWTWKRPDIVDMIIKERLKNLREKKVHVKLSFNMIYWGTPVVMLCSCLRPESMPKEISFFAMAALLLILAVCYFKEEWMGNMDRIALFLLIPFVVYFGETNSTRWMGSSLMILYNMSFILLGIFVVVTVKYSRRREGFKISPMDFLILFIALVVPFLPHPHVVNYHTGLMAGKIIILFFTYEVIITELRGELKTFNLLTLVFLAVLSTRGFL